MLTAEQLAEARQMIEAAASASNGNGTHTPAGWTAPAPIAANPWAAAAAPAGIPMPEKVLVPIKVQTPGGSVRMYFQFPGEMAANPQTLMAVLAQMAQTMPLDVYVPKQNWGGGGGGGYRNGNGGGGGWGGGNRGGW